MMRMWSYEEGRSEEHRGHNLLETGYKEWSLDSGLDSLDMDSG
jgi:hypothetical protein